MRRRHLAALALVLPLSLLAGCGNADTGSPDASPTLEPSRASEEQARQLNDQGALPQVTFDDAGVPSITIPKKEAPESLVVTTLKEGQGKAIEENSSMDMHYTGWRWSTGEKFDSSYDRKAPASFQMGSLITGMKEGLLGLKEGSTAMLVIPPKMAYGDTPDEQKGKTLGPNESPTGTIIFVVNVLKVN